MFLLHCFNVKSCGRKEPCLEAKLRLHGSTGTCWRILIQIARSSIAQKHNDNFFVLCISRQGSGSFKSSCKSGTTTRRMQFPSRFQGFLDLFTIHEGHAMQQSLCRFIKNEYRHQGGIFLVLFLLLISQELIHACKDGTPA